MHRSLKAILLLSGLVFFACEDGPNQPYKPSPDGADQKWNDGKTPPAVDPGKQGFDNQSGGANKSEICPGDVKAKVWADMVLKPILPPTKGAGLDISGKDWNGLTIDDAEKTLCQSENDGDVFGDGTQVNSWGDDGQVLVDYLVSTRKILFMVFLPGYIGTLDATTHDGKTSFSISVNYTQITKNGKPYTIDWNDPVKFNVEANELYDAMTATFAPALPQDPDCVGSGACIIGNFGDYAFLGFGALGLYMWVDSIYAPQPVPSEFTRIDMFLSKTLPFSVGNPMLKLDAAGPLSLSGKLGKAPAPCTMQMGMNFGDFLKNCVEVTGDGAKDQVELNKLMGGLSHSTERFSFDIQGVDLNFSDKNLPDDQIIKDKDKPDPTDIATQFSIDQSTLGKLANDYAGNDPTTGKKDLHGAGLVYLEYARLVQDRLTALTNPATPRKLGDPACLEPNVDPKTPIFPAGCTGFEGFVTASPATTDPNLNVLALGQNAALVNPKMTLGLKPGHPQATICLDANGDLATGYYDCAAPAGANGDLFSTSFTRVLQVLGKGKTSNLPNDVRDVRFFWKQYVIALVKYLKVAGTANETPAGVHAQTIDVDNLFFDSEGSGQFEIGEYVDRRFASKSQDPMDVVFSADVKNGIFNGYEFSREIYRGETGLYAAVLENKADGYGQENTALLTNLFGSPVLAAGWHDSGFRTAYYCATHMDPDLCDGQLAPHDALGKMLVSDDGKAILAPYPGAFGRSVFALGNTPIKVMKTFPEIESALVSVPLRKSPYDPASKAPTSLDLLIPWTPKQPGIGFPIAVNGTFDKFISTSQLDFSGTTISANVDYDIAIDPNSMQPDKNGALELKAVETVDFLGEVFLCRDGATGDLLRVRMYTPAAEVLDWLEGHPGQYDKCGIIVRYSPYGNYPDFITSLANGVRLGITQGGGFGRVVDVTLFVPGQ